MQAIVKRRSGRWRIWRVWRPPPFQRPPSNTLRTTAIRAYAMRHNNYSTTLVRVSDEERRAWYGWFGL